MKSKFRFIAAILMMAFVFTACGGKAIPSERTAKRLAEKHVEQIMNGDYEAVLADCSDTLKSQLSTDALKSGWDTIAASAGEYIMVYSATYTRRDDYATVNTILEYENTGLVISLTYNSEEKIRGLWLNTSAVKYDITDNDILTESEIVIGEHQLKGILTVPDNAVDYPVAVLVQGSGSSDFDETIGANKPFKEIAHYLAEKGIATIRINKRLYQKPDLMHDKLTIYDEYMDDIYSAIDYAKENVGADVYVIGHSQGAMTAPKIALDNGAKGIVMMAGTIRGLEDVVYDQNIATLRATEEYSAKEKEKIAEAVLNGVNSVKALKEGDTGAVLGIPAEYWLSLRDLDAENILKNRLDIPVLIMQGTADFQISYENDYQYMKSVLEDKENITFVSYEGLNHLFMPQSIPGAIDVSEYRRENHIPENVLSDIANFILNNN